MCHDLASHLVKPLRQALHDQIRSLESKRQALPQLMPVDDPEHLALTAEINAARKFLETRLRRISEIQLDDYPERFLALFDGVPLEAAAVRPFRDLAMVFASDLGILRRTLMLPNAENWIKALDEE